MIIVKFKKYINSGKPFTSEIIVGQSLEDNQLKFEGIRTSNRTSIGKIKSNSGSLIITLDNSIVMQTFGDTIHTRSGFINSFKIFFGS